MVRAMVATPALRQAQEGALGTRVSRVGHEVGGQRCQLAPANTTAMTFFSPPAFAGAGSGEHRR